MRGLPFHYGWVIVFTGMLVLLSCLGLARFSFGMLLPSMSESLQLTYGERGYLSSGYLIGYLLMVALVSLVNSRLGSRLTITIGLLLRLRIPPPIILRNLRAFSTNSLELHRREPMGALRPLERQKHTESAGLASSLAGTSKVTAALKIRAPSR